jgi:hypothetical protein
MPTALAAMAGSATTLCDNPHRSSAGRSAAW